MADKKFTVKRIVIFSALAYVFAWILFLLIPLLGINYGEETSVIILAVAMFMPSLSNVLTRLITKEGFKNTYLNPNFKGHVKDYILVYFAPSLLLLLSAAFYFLVYPSQFDGNMTALKEANPGSMAGLTTNYIIVISIIQIIVIGPIVNIIPTLGEEFGWRAYLLPKLRELVSDRVALVVTGVIWGLWHAPVIVMGHNYGKEYIGYPVLGILIMIVFCVMLGVIEGYFTIKTDSVIPAAMIHSTVNAGASFPIIFAKKGYNTLLGPAITGIVGGFLFILLAVFLYIKSDKTKKPSNEAFTTNIDN